MNTVVAKAIAHPMLIVLRHTVRTNPNKAPDASRIVAWSRRDSAVAQRE